MTADDSARLAQALARCDELLELDPAERAAALATLAARDPELARRVSSLLAADSDAGDYLERPAGEIAAEWLDEMAARERGAPGAVYGPYRLLRQLGRGGMGEVWEAERIDGQFERTVALKLLRPGMDSDELVERFLRERQILARLSHPGIARLLDGGRSAEGRPWLALELVDGLPITEHFRRGALAVDERVRLLAEACDAVEAAHRQLVVHRDLKPSNILVSAEGRVQLLDFGIAKLLDVAADPALTRAGLGVLTPSYAAPEQILGEPVTTATDVYSLGVVLHELLVGVLPHRREGRTAASLASEVARESTQRPSTALRRNEGIDPRERRRLERRLRGDLDNILMKALSREPERRYSSAAAFGDDLRRYLAGRPVAARPDSVGYRTAKFVRRHRLGVAFAALLLLTLLGGLAAALWQAERAARAAAAAAANARRAERTKDFLISLFQVADPMQSGGESVSAKDLLEQGAQRLSSELATEPALRADLLEAVARIESSLGLLDAAEHSAVLAIELRAGAPAAERATAEATLGAVRIQQGQLDAAAELLERSRRELVAASAEPLVLARVESDLGQVKFWRKESAEAEAIERSVWETYRAELGEEHVETAIHLRNLAVVLDDLGRLDEAEAAYRRSQEILEHNLGPDHPHLGQSYLNLAVVLDKRERFDEAEALYRRALDLRRRTVGDRHIQTAQTLQVFANSLTQRGKLDEAEKVEREALEIFRSANPAHFEVGKCLNGLGVIAMRRGDFAAAEQWLREAIANYESSLGRDHPFRWWTQGSLSKAVLARGRAEEAERLAREVLHELERISGPESEDAEWAHGLLVGPLRTLDRGSDADAEAALATAIAAKRKAA